MRVLIDAWVSFLFVDGVDAEDSMEGSWFSSLDVKENLIDSDANEVEHLMTWVESPLKGRAEHSNSITIDSK